GRTAVRERCARRAGGEGVRRKERTPRACRGPTAPRLRPACGGARRRWPTTRAKSAKLHETSARRDVSLRARRARRQTRQMMRTNRTAAGSPPDYATCGLAPIVEPDRAASSTEWSHRYRDCLILTVAFTSMEDIRCALSDCCSCFRWCWL